MPTPRPTPLALLLAPLLAVASAAAPALLDPDAEFRQLADAPGWTEVFRDAGTADWAGQWLLDGERASVSRTPAGLDFEAGPRIGQDADHAVLWTRASFEGELLVRFDYTRTDRATRDVNILYLHATGTGHGPHAADLAIWSELRRVPAMRLYFEHLQAWHLSFAAFPNQGPAGQPDYLRVRRYPIAPGRPFAATEVPPTVYDTGLFSPGVTHLLTVIKTARRLVLRVGTAEGARTFAWDVSGFAVNEAGRIGLRHMHGRSAVYANFRVSQRPAR